MRLVGCLMKELGRGCQLKQTDLAQPFSNHSQTNSVYTARLPFHCQVLPTVSCPSSAHIGAVSGLRIQTSDRHATEDWPMGYKVHFLPPSQRMSP